MGNCLGNSIELSLTQGLTGFRNPPLDKKALLVGLNYTGTNAALKGCINDVKHFKKQLIEQFAYKDIKLLTDKELSRKQNVLENLRDFLAVPQTTMIFHYSGHGTQRFDLSGDEPDGKDEVLYTKYGVMASDDEINELISKLPTGVKLVIIVDACHSGSIGDLEYQMMDDNKVEKVSQKVVAADVICISGCRDNQTSADIQNGVWSYGALSNSFGKVLAKATPTTTWRELQISLKEHMRAEGYAQISQLSVSKLELLDQPLNL